MKKWISLMLLVALIAGAAGCANMNRQQKGTVIGAGTGAAIGGIIGKNSGDTAMGALLGAMVGGAAGAYIGGYMDDQAEEIERDLEGASVERVGEGIKITFDSGILFEVAKSDLQAGARTNLGNLSAILQKYPDTDILIEGHTDADGAEDYNLELSRNRANSVANYLSGLGVDATRFTIMGYGETQPIADNGTVEGKRQNRRVELAIMANDKLKKIAEQKAG
ncbi:OmpA family protein [bacterium]|nr:OmpA family protein [bacterium]